jgi:long-chain acyl-CoA synthetase
MVIQLSLGLRAVGMKKGDPVAIISENRVEWAASDFAISCAGGVTVPVSPLYSPSQLAHVLRDSGASRAFVSSLETVAMVQECFAGSGPELSYFILEGEPAGERVMSLEELARLGIERHPDGEKDFTKNALSVDQNDLSTIMYTSGTSGKPKGVRLSHRNITSNVIATSKALKVTPQDKCLSFLPLSHAFERTAGFLTIFYNGASIAYAESVYTVPRDLREVSPTILVSVPRLYEKMEQSMMEEADNMAWPKSVLFTWALELAKKTAHRITYKSNLPLPLRLKRVLADLLVYRRIRARMGGKVRMYISGGAPLEKELAEMFYGCGMLVLEGYGLTEASPTCTVNRIDSFKFGSVGLPLPGVTLRMTDEREVLVRGDNVMLGYQKLEEETKSSMSGEWLHTGDLGEIDEDGFLYLTGRKKEIIITSWGVTVAPTPVEFKIRRSPFIKDVALVGNGCPYIGALVIPDAERIAKHLKIQIRGENDSGILYENHDVRALIQSEIDKLSSHFSKKERIKRFRILPRNFSMERGELTTTYKLVRPVIEKNFRAEIELIYRENSP